MMHLFDLKIQATKKEAVLVSEINSTSEGMYSEKQITEVTSFDKGAKKFIDSIEQLIKDVKSWYEIQPILLDSIEINKASLLSEYDNDVKDIIEKMLNIIIEEIKNNRSYDSFRSKYQKRISEFWPTKIESEIKDISKEEQADKVVANFAKLYVLVFSNNDLSDSYRTELLNSLHTESFLNAGGYNNFNYLIMKIITNPKVIENKTLFYNKNGEKGFLYQLVERSHKVTGTFKECAFKYLDKVYSLEHEQHTEKERRFIIFGATHYIETKIKNKKEKYNEYELFKMQELYRTIYNRYSIKYIKDSDENGLIAAAKNASMKNFDKKGQFIFNRIIEDLQRGSLEPIKYEEMPALYENEELLIAYFRMVNYLLMNYPEAIGVEAYGKFVYTIKYILHDLKNKINKELFYSFLYRLYEKNYLKLLDHSWSFHIEGEEPFDSLNVIFHSYQKEIDKDKKDYYDNLIFSK